MNSLDTNLKLVDVVESIKDTEDINTVLLGLVNEVVNGVVRQRSVGNTVGTTEKHLEGNVGDELSHLAESVPGVLVEESHGDIEGSTTPALKRVEVGEGVAGLLGDVQEINGTDTGSQKRLVGVTPGGIHEKSTLVVTDSLGEGLGALLKDDVSPSLLVGQAGVDLLASRVDELRDGDLTLELGLADLALDAAAVDGNVAKVSQQLLGTVLAANEVEELRSVVDEGGPAVSIDESGVGEKGSQEGDVGLDTSDTELNQGTQRLSAGNLVCAGMCGQLGKHAVVVG